MNLKLPTLKKPDGGESSESKAAKFFSDLYRDLADRRLLLPLAALLVAIVAVPLLLKSSSESEAPAPAPAIDTADTSELDAAVIVSNPGIRNYRKRLDQLKAKNPFQTTGGDGSSGGTGTAKTTTDGSGGSDSAASSSSSTSSTSATDSSSASSGSSSASVSIDSGSDTGGSTPTPAPDPTDPADTGDDTTPEDVKPETRFYASRIDVTVGPVGETEKVKGVKQLEFLPDHKDPVVAYLGLVDDNAALFSVNPGVAETEGQGDCAPRGNACMYLSLKVGQEQRFVYGDEDDATIYRLKLLDTRIVRVQDPRKRAQDAGDGKAPHAPADASSRTK